MQYITIIVSVLGFLITYTGITRKVVTKEDIKSIVDQLNDISDRVIKLEKELALLEYRVKELEGR